MKPFSSVLYLIGQSSCNMRFFRITTAKYVLGAWEYYRQKTSYL